MLSKTFFKFFNKFEKFTLIFLSVCYSISKIILLDQTLGCLSLTMIPNQHLQFPPYEPHFRVGSGEYSGGGDQGLLIAEALNQRLDEVELVTKTERKTRVHPHSTEGKSSRVFLTNISEVIRATFHLKETFQKLNNE